MKVFNPDNRQSVLIDQVNEFKKMLASREPMFDGEPISRKDLRDLIYFLGCSIVTIRCRVEDIPDEDILKNSRAQFDDYGETMMISFEQNGKPYEYPMRVKK